MSSNFGSVFLVVATMAYLAPMELQTQIDEMKQSLNRQNLINIALAVVIVVGVGVAVIQPAGDAEFGTITCKKWRVIDKDGKQRIAAGTTADGESSVLWKDKDGKLRIDAATFADGTVSLPTKDLKPK